MAAMTLNQRQPDASAEKPVASEVLAGSKPKSPVILALDLGQETGWALRSTARARPAAQPSSEFGPVLRSSRGPLAFEPDAAIGIRVHEIHDRSDRFRSLADIHNRATCHLTPQDGPARGLLEE